MMQNSPSSDSNHRDDGSDEPQRLRTTAIAASSQLHDISLHELIRRLHSDDEIGWIHVKQRCMTHPWEIHPLDQRGRSCLHAACAKKPPPCVIRALLRACEQQEKQQQIINEGDNHGRTPLAIAVSSNASLQVIKLLLSVSTYPAQMTDHRGELPLHLVCTGYDFGQLQLLEMLLDIYPEAVQHGCLVGRTPLHAAIETSAPIEVISLLVESYPEAVKRKSRWGNPLFLAIEQKANVDVISILIKADPSCNWSRDSENNLPLRRAIEQHSNQDVLVPLAAAPEIVCDADEILENTVLHTTLENGVPRTSLVHLLVKIAPQLANQKSKCGHTPLTLACRRYVLQALTQNQRSKMFSIICILAKAAYYGRIQDDDHVLHAIAALGLPWQIAKIAIEQFQDQVSKVNSEGNYPLHLALLSPSWFENKSTLSKMILDADRKVARIANHNGHTALMLAAAVGAAKNKVIVNETLLLDLVHADPSSLSRIDPEHRLYPFQTAAAVLATTTTRIEGESSSSLLSDEKSRRARSSWDKPVEQDLSQLTTIFSLLMAAPNLVESPSAQFNSVESHKC